MSVVPHVSINELREAAETAQLDVERYIELADNSFTDLEFELIRQRSSEAQARLDAVASQQPDRQPFTGRARA